MENPAIPPKQRAAAGAARGWLEDLPEGVSLAGGLPDIQWITIPPGVFKMGNNRSSYSDEKPEFDCHLIRQPYQISRYPVTVGQFQPFLEPKDNGRRPYDEPRYWSAAGLDWRAKNDIKGPEDYQPAFQTPSHPRVGVSWFEAVAYCHWLTEQFRAAGMITEQQEVRLPSEGQWERAARGSNGREYPWGNDKALEKHCNCMQTDIGQTSAVGLFPSGDTPAEPGNQRGIADMSGNVWEWCGTVHRLYGKDYEQAASKDSAEGEGNRVLRGGSWLGGDPGGLLGFCRLSNTPGGRDDYVGFRVVLAGVFGG